jgi:hypothetical protein
MKRVTMNVNGVIKILPKSNDLEAILTLSISTSPHPQVTIGNYVCN